MQSDEARFVAFGYAWAMADNGRPTVVGDSGCGDWDFANAFAQAHADINEGRRFDVPSVQEAWLAWNHHGHVHRPGHSTPAVVARRAEMLAAETCDHGIPRTPGTPCGICDASEYEAACGIEASHVAPDGVVHLVADAATVAQLAGCEAGQ